MILHFEPLAPPLADQLKQISKDVRIDEIALARCEDMRKAINTVKVFGIATDTEAGKMYKRLMQAVIKAIED